MKNNKGIGTREILIVILLLLSVTAFLMAITLSGADNQKINAFRDNALTFSKAIITNQASFRNTSEIYLGEAIEEGVMNQIKNALGSGYCDPSLSKVNFEDGHVYTTLKCGKYLVDHYEIKTADDIPIYEVTEWSEEKPSGKNVEETTLYNCYDGKKLAFKEYYEENYLVFMVDKEYNESARTISAIEKKTALVVTDKTYYRTKKLVDFDK